MESHMSRFETTRAGRVALPNPETSTRTFGHVAGKPFSQDLVINCNQLWVRKAGLPPLLESDYDSPLR